MTDVKLTHRPDLAAELDPAGKDWWQVHVLDATVDRVNVWRTRGSGPSYRVAIEKALRARALTEQQALTLEATQGATDYSESTRRPDARKRNSGQKKRAGGDSGGSAEK